MTEIWCTGTTPVVLYLWYTCKASSSSSSSSSSVCGSVKHVGRSHCVPAETSETFRGASAKLLANVLANVLFSKIHYLTLILQRCLLKENCRTAWLCCWGICTMQASWEIIMINVTMKTTVLQSGFKFLHHCPAYFHQPIWFLQTHFNHSELLTVQKSPSFSIMSFCNNFPSQVYVKA